MQRRLVWMILLCGLSSTAAMAGAAQDQREVDDLAGPPPELAAPAPGAPKLVMPERPAFALPQVEDGLRSARELRLRGGPLLDTEVTVRGYVTGRYDCAAELAKANPKASRARLRALLRATPSPCQPPSFALADRKDAAPEASIWVVDVPPPEAKAKALALGESVTVRGLWSRPASAPAAHATGVLRYRALERVAPPAAEVARLKVPAARLPEVTVVTKAPLRLAVPTAQRASSIQQLTACNREFTARRYDAAIPACQAAVATWRGNHLAWYTLASLHMAKGEWAKAKAETAQAVTLRPDQGMYQLYHGVAIYEEALDRARQAARAAAPAAPAPTTLAPGDPALPAAQQALLRALRLAPRLWRAHFYLARVEQDLGEDALAAAELAATLETYPSYAFAYAALIEVYRRWDYLDAALEIAALGAAQVPARDAADLWFAAGTLRAAKGQDAEAVAAFTRALTARPDLIAARLQRGVLQLRLGADAEAKADLEAAAASSDPAVASAKAMIARLLSDLARKRRK